MKEGGQHHVSAALGSEKNPKGPRGSMDVSDKTEISCPYRDSNSGASNR